MSDAPYDVRFLPAARRAIAHRLPEAVAAAVIEFGASALATDPYRVGTPLVGPLDGCHGLAAAPTGVIYRVDDDARTVYVLDIAHRSDAYRSP